MPMHIWLCSYVLYMKCLNVCTKTLALMHTIHHHSIVIVMLIIYDRFTMSFILRQGYMLLGGKLETVCIAMKRKVIVVT